MLDRTPKRRKVDAEPVGRNPIPDDFPGDAKDGAQYTGQHPSALYRAVRDGSLQCLRYGPRSMRFEKAELDRWMERHRTKDSSGQEGQHPLKLVRGAETENL